MMNKFNLNDVVKYKNRAGLFVVTYLESGTEGTIYSIELKNVHDGLMPEKEETVENAVLHEVAEVDLEAVFN